MTAEIVTGLPSDPALRESGASRQAVIELMACYRSVVRRMDRILRRHGLTFARYQVLSQLIEAPDGTLGMTQLGVALGVHPTSITNSVDRLEASRLVQRMADQADHRIVKVRLTSRGVAVHGRATPDINTHVFEAIGLGPSSVETLIRLTRRLRQAVEDY